MTPRGQLKLQEMSFVLVALMIFFGLVALVFISVRVSHLKSGAQDLKDDAAREAVRRIAGSPELVWAGCPGCIDADKAFVLKERIRVNQSVAAIWQFTYLALEWVYPPQPGSECTSATYPSCTSLTLIERTEHHGIASSAFVNLCHWNTKQDSMQCDLGRVVAAGNEVIHEK